jgi:aconitate hydratase
VKIRGADGAEKEAKVRVRIDTENELEYFKNGGILHFVLRNLNAAA